MESERSTGALVLAGLALLVLAASFSQAWFSFESSTGRRTPEGGLHDPADTQVVRTTASFHAFEVRGDAPPSDPASAGAATSAIGWLVATAAAACLPLLAGELPRVGDIVPRRLGLAGLAVAIAALGAALWVGWAVLPGTMSGHGVAGPFTSVKQDDGYIRSTLGLGYVAAAVATPLLMAAFAFKFQAGSADPSLVEHFARKARRGGAA